MLIFARYIRLWTFQFHKGTIKTFMRLSAMPRPTFISIP